MPPKKDDTVERAHKGVYRNCSLWRARIWDVDREVYLGHFEEAAQAGRAYDRASIKIRGPDGARMDGLNFPLTDYINDLVAIMDAPLEQVLADLRASGVTANPVDSAKPLK